MDENDETTYLVVRNDEEQYSIWAAGSPPPLGWQHVGFTGTRAECLTHIDEVWTDMRPRSVREHLAQLADGAVDETAELFFEDDAPDLVSRLSVPGPVVVRERMENTADRFLENLRAGYVHILFSATRGGTELGVRVDPAASDWSSAEQDGGSGPVRVVGDLVLDFQPVRCFADIDLASMSGEGWLEPVKRAD